jgi:hypothetical protein
VDLLLDKTHAAALESTSSAKSEKASAGITPAEALLWPSPVGQIPVKVQISLEQRVFWGSKRALLQPIVRHVFVVVCCFPVIMDDFLEQQP